MMMSTALVAVKVPPKKRNKWYPRKGSELCLIAGHGHQVEMIRGIVDKEYYSMLTVRQAYGMPGTTHEDVKVYVPGEGGKKGHATLEVKGIRAFLAMPKVRDQALSSERVWQYESGVRYVTTKRVTDNGGLRQVTMVRTVADVSAYLVTSWAWRWRGLAYFLKRYRKTSGLRNRPFVVVTR